MIVTQQDNFVRIVFTRLEKLNLFNNQETLELPLMIEANRLGLQNKVLLGIRRQDDYPEMNDTTIWLDYKEGRDGNGKKKTASKPANE